MYRAYSHNGSNLCSKPVAKFIFPDWGIHCKKKLTENFVSLTGYNRLKYQWDGKLFQYVDQVNPTSSYEEDGVFRGLWHSAKFSDSFPSTFRPFSVNFPTNESIANRHQRGANPHSPWLHSSTLPLRHTNFLYIVCVALSLP